MNKLVSIVVVLAVCLAGLASGGCFGGKKKNKDVDFKGLGDFLVENYNGYENFAFMRQNLASLTDGQRKAAEMLEQLIGLDTCNDETLKTLATAKYAGLAKILRKGRGKAEKRIGDMISAKLQQLIQLCTPYMDKQLKAKVSSASTDLKQFLELTRPSYISFYFDKKVIYDMVMLPDNCNYLVSNTYKLANNKHSKASQRIGKRRLVGFLNELAARDGQSVDYLSKVSFEANFKKYLVEPCKKFVNHFQPLFDGVHAIAPLMEDKFQYVRERSVQFRQVAYTDKVCQAVLILDHNDDAHFALGFNKEMLMTSAALWQSPSSSKAT